MHFGCTVLLLRSSGSGLHVLVVSDTFMEISEMREPALIASYYYHISQRATASEDEAGISE
jgi:hypothetical protein